MHNNIVLIGMAGAGKSTIGVQLAKLRGMEFVDTDLLIQSAHRQTLQAILDEQGYLALRQHESDILSNLNLSNTVIATGGSAVYSDKAMQHLQKIGVVIYLEVSFKDIAARVNNVDTRGIACPPELSFRDVFDEREPLYRQYANIVFNNGATQADNNVIESLNTMIENQS